MSASALRDGLDTSVSSAMETGQSAASMFQTQNSGSTSGGSNPLSGAVPNIPMEGAVGLLLSAAIAYLGGTIDSVLVGGIGALLGLAVLFLA